MNPIEWARHEVLGNTLFVWGLGLLVFLVAWGAMTVLRRVLSGRLARLNESRNIVALRVVSRVIDETRTWFYVVIAAFIGTRVWGLSAEADAAATKIAIITLLLQAGIWVSSAASVVIEARRNDVDAEHRSAIAAIDILSFIVRVVIWALVLLVVLDNLGINITALVAGLGVGGIAVALAAQSILGDLFASLSILLDKPFVVGDFLIIDQHLGTVEKIGIKTTRLRSLSGEQLVFSNNDLLSSRIRNFGRMFERRVVFSLGVTYQTGSERLEQIPGIVREIVEAQDDVRFDRAHFQKYGDFSLVFEIVYFVLSSDYIRYMDVQQAINLEIYKRFESEGIEFAYPTQTLFVNQQGG